jgi:hypothetical protein
MDNSPDGSGEKKTVKGYTGYRLSDIPLAPIGALAILDGAFDIWKWYSVFVFRVLISVMKG